MNKRATSIILATALCVSAIPAETMAATVSNTIRGKAVIGEEAGYSFRLNFNNLTTGSNKIFHQDIAEAAILLSADFGEKGDITIVDGDESFLEQLGFENIETVELNQQVYATDPYDVVVFSMGRRLVKRLGRTYAVYALAIRGTLQLREWASNFDVGSLDPVYERQTGEHPDWKNKNHHKGFDVASERVLAAMDEYINRFADEDSRATRTVLITGHSRGAAVANLIGKEYEDRYNKSRKAVKPYTYTFGTPTVTVESNKVLSSYKTIYNVINDDDLVPCIPLSDWGFKRYGKDIHMSVENSRLLKRMWKKDDMSSLLYAYTEAYNDKLRSYSSIQLNSVSPEIKIPDGQPYQSAEAADMLKMIKFLVLGNANDTSTTRDFLYQYRSTIWVPNSISSDYDAFYIDAPYDEDSTKEEKKQFDRIAKKYDCKRVKIAPFFLIVAMDRVATAILSESDKEELTAVEELSAELPWDKQGEMWKQNLETISEILKKAADVSDDVEILLYACMNEASVMTNERDKVTALLRYLRNNNNSSGLLHSHMPTTYYFIINHLVLASEN